MAGIFTLPCFFLSFYSLVSNKTTLETVAKSKNQEHGDNIVSLGEKHFQDDETRNTGIMSVMTQSSEQMQNSATLKKRNRPQEVKEEDAWSWRS
jgi:hypothetical protein